MKRFISSYQGSAEYDINGTIYSVRTFALPNSSATEQYKVTERAEVGTVRAKHWPNFCTFPPAEVMAEFPGYIAARVNPDAAYRIEYNGSAPATFANHLGWLEVRL